MKPKVLAAISGGVDSAVMVIELLKAGYEVIGTTLRLLPDQSDEEFQVQSDKVTALAQKLGIVHTFLDRRNAFRERVLAPCHAVLVSGQTPNPCVLCNPAVKFGELLSYADEQGIAFLATGHYAGISRDADGIVSLHRGADTAKDQTYFLCGLTQAQLKRILLPLSGLNKSDVRRIAREHGLPNADAPESQDACFMVEGESFADTMRRHFGDAGKGGCFVDETGKNLGSHDGVARYTIGQRKGLRIALGKPAYITRIDATSGDIQLSTDESLLMSESLMASAPNWQSGTPPQLPLECKVQIRYRSRPVACRVEKAGEGLTVTFASPQRAVTPGQAAAFYAGDQLLGGATILH